MTDVARLLAELVAIPTQQAGGERGGGDERAFCDHVAPLLRARGADSVIVADAPRTDGSRGAYLLATWGEPRRIINAHVDTVPANAGWTRDPWTPAIVGDRLYGLGSADTKGAIAATLVALEAVRPRDIGVLFSGDEEAGSAVLTAFLATAAARPIREVIVCEPTARRAGIAHRGVLAGRARVRGRGGHSSKADEMPRPIAQLARLAVAIDDMGRARLADGPPGMTGLCTNVAALRGGVAFNVVPEMAELEWSIRPYPGFDRAAWDREVAARASAIDPAIELAATIDHAPFALRAGAPLADRAREHARELGTVDFWTEAALWASHGADAIVIGPGDIAQAHAGDEHVALADLDWAVALYADLLTS